MWRAGGSARPRRGRRPRCRAGSLASPMVLATPRSLTWKPGSTSAPGIPTGVVITAMANAATRATTSIQTPLCTRANLRRPASRSGQHFHQAGDGGECRTGTHICPQLQTGAVGCGYLQQALAPGRMRGADHGAATVHNRPELPRHLLASDGKSTGRPCAADFTGTPANPDRLHNPILVSDPALPGRGATPFTR